MGPRERSTALVELRTFANQSAEADSVLSFINKCRIHLEPASSASSRSERRFADVPVVVRLPEVAYRRQSVVLGSSTTTAQSPSLQEMKP